MHRGRAAQLITWRCIYSAGRALSLLVCHTKRGQSLFLLQCCLIEGTDSFPPLITSRQPSGGKPWDMATFSPRSDSQLWKWIGIAGLKCLLAPHSGGDCRVLGCSSLANSAFEGFYFCAVCFGFQEILRWKTHVCISGSLAKWDGDDDSRLGCGKYCSVILLWHSLG